ncbi:unnamed protein product [Sphacelaria rigidula]
MHDERLPNIVMHGIMVGGKRRAGRPARRLQHWITDYYSYFGINATSWTQVALDVSEWFCVVEEGANMYMAAWTKARHAKKLFAVLPLGPPQCLPRTSNK